MKELIIAFFNFIREMSRGLLMTGGKESSMRFTFLFSCIISNITVFGIWSGLSIYEGKILPVHESIIALYCFANGISVTGKLIQKNFEDKYSVNTKTIENNNSCEPPKEDNNPKS